MTGHKKVLTHVEQVTPEWLTAVLTQAGAMQNGHVQTISVASGSGHWSQNARLTLTYSDSTRGNCPPNLFLKLVNTDLGDGEFFQASEVNFYIRDYIDLPDAPLVRCYDGAYDPQQHRYHLLLEDKSETHRAAYDLKPTLAHGKAFAEAAAALHAHWWGETRLQEIKTPFHDADFINAAVTIGEEAIEPTQRAFGKRFKAHWMDLIHQIYDQLGTPVAKRGQDSTHFTLIHGDPNPGNILVPKVGERPLYLIDQQPFEWSITTWLGVYDLAYLIALYWDSDLRRALEQSVLRCYYNALLKRGITGYSWEQLYEDYRLCVAMTVPVAIEYMSDGGDPDWNEFRFGMISRALTAFDDLNCAEFL